MAEYIRECTNTTKYAHSHLFFCDWLINFYTLKGTVSCCFFIWISTKLLWFKLELSTASNQNENIHLGILKFCDILKFYHHDDELDLDWFALFQNLFKHIVD